MPISPGLHHLTAITADGQKCFDFYSGLLGLRLVKRTVNFDDPRSYHFYFGDDRGSPGSIVTFFVIPGLVRGRIGSPMIDGISLSLPEPKLKAAIERLKKAGCPVDPLPDGAVYTFDPDGQQITLFWAPPEQPGPRLAELPVLVRHAQTTRDFVGTWLGDSALRMLDIDSHVERARNGAGTVHHLAFRVESEEAQLDLQQRLVAANVHVSPQMNRGYFHSIYFREPGGILLEVATDAPGFATDEAPDALGRKLCLPENLEPHRREIEQALPKIDFGF
jgi:glyoxalase family protein